MANYRNRKSMVKTVAFSLVVLLVLAALASAIAALCLGGKNNGWFDKEPTDVPDDGGSVVGNIENNGLTLTTARIASSEYEAYGIGDDAESAYILTVTTTPATAEDTFGWAVSDSTNITLTPSADTLSCTVEVTGAFGTQKTITVTSNVNGAVNASCTVDYIKSVTAATVTLSATSVKFGDSETSYTVSITPTYGVGTLTPAVTIDGGSLESNLGIDGSAAKTFTGTSFAVTSPYATFGGSSTDKSVIATYNNAFIEAVTGTTTDGSLTVNYTVTYGGTTIATASAVTAVAFDVSGVTVEATEITLNTSGLIFYEGGFFGTND